MSNPKLNIIPLPKVVSQSDGEFKINSSTPIIADVKLNNEATLLASALGLEIANAAVEQPSIKLSIDPSLSDELGAEGYKLEISEAEVNLAAPTPTGIFYGVQTLLQLLPPELFVDDSAKDNLSLPCLSITDTPRFKWRGIMLDVARHYMPVEFIKKYIDVLAMHKFNTLHFHMTEDQGWRIEIKKYPELTAIGSVREESPIYGDRDTGDGKPYGPYFYTQDELRDLVAYAKTRHIEMVPEIEMPGHTLGVLAAFPELGCTGGPYKVRTKWGVEDDVFCAGNEKVFELLEDVLREVFEIFDSEYIHIGADECPKKRWDDCPKCKARMEAEGLENSHELQSWFIRRIEKFLNANNKRLIGWDEILEGGLAPNATVMAWRGMEHGLKAVNEGHDVILSPNTHCYFDYYEAVGPDEPEAIGGNLPMEKVYSFEPVDGIAEENKKHVIGVQGNLWTEYMWLPKDVEHRTFPRACALAEVAWGKHEDANFDDFKNRLDAHLMRLDGLKVNYRK